MTSPKPSQPSEEAKAFVAALEKEADPAFYRLWEALGDETNDMIARLFDAHVARVTEGLVAAHGYYQWLFTVWAPECEQGADPLTLATQIDNYVAGQLAQVERLRKLLGPCQEVILNPEKCQTPGCNWEHRKKCGTDRPCLLHDREDEKGETRG